MRIKFKGTPYDTFFPCTEETINRVCEQIGVPNSAKTTVSVKEVVDDSRANEMLQGQSYNIAQLNFLTKVLESFSEDQLNTFYALVYTRKTNNIKQLINLTYNLNNVSLVNNLYDIESAGRKMYLDTQGYVDAEKFKEFNGKDYFKQALENNIEHVITPYGILFVNNKNYEEVFDGKHLPFFDYTNKGSVSISYEKKREYLYFPFQKTEIVKALENLGVEDIRSTSILVDAPYISDKAHLSILDGDEIYNKLMDFSAYSYYYTSLTKEDKNKLNFLMDTFETESAKDLEKVIKNLNFFNVREEIHNSCEYGEYIICKRNNLYYNEGPLKEFIDFEKCGNKYRNIENGCFTENGYISYFGYDQEMSELLSNIGLAPQNKHLQTQALYMPLIGETYDLYAEQHNRYDSLNQNHIYIMNASELADYADEVKDAIRKYDITLNERGLMEYYNKANTVNAKVQKLSFDVEIIDNQLMGVAKLELNAPLNQFELDDIKDYIEGQCSDGWGEGFEQREIKCGEKEFYVSFWQPCDWELKTGKEIGLEAFEPAEEAKMGMNMGGMYQ